MDGVPDVVVDGRVIIIIIIIISSSSSSSCARIVRSVINLVTFTVNLTTALHIIIAAFIHYKHTMSVSILNVYSA